jgi:hypothetical protein
MREGSRFLLYIIIHLYSILKLAIVKPFMVTTPRPIGRGRGRVFFYLQTTSHSILKILATFKMVSI